MPDVAKYRFAVNIFFYKTVKYLICLTVVPGPGVVYFTLNSVCAQDSPDTSMDYVRTEVPFAGSARYNKMLTDAMILQNRVDSLERQADDYRQEIMFMDNVTERNRLQFHLGILEDEMKSLQYEADSLFKLLSEMKDFEQERSDLIILDTIIEGIRVYNYKTDKPDIGNKLDNNSAVDQGSSNIFLISKKPAYSAENPFETDFKIPSGVFYRVQMAAISQEAGWDQFGGIQPVTVEMDRERKLRKYYAGKFTKFSEADSALIRIREAGFRDAFIVGYYNGERMSTEQVREFEKTVR
jgi:hypothetical protein